MVLCMFQAESMLQRPRLPEEMLTPLREIIAYEKQAEFEIAFRAMLSAEQQEDALQLVRLYVSRQIRRLIRGYCYR